MIGTVIDPRDLRRALGRFATGVTVITTQAPNGRMEGVTANSFAALSLEPPLVLWSLSRQSSTLAGFRESGFFAINVLRASQIALSHRFATPGASKYEGIDVDAGLGGCPLLRQPLATFECETETQLDGGDHVLFVGRVRRTAWHDGEPLIFSAGQVLHVLAAARGDGRGRPQ